MDVDYQSEMRVQVNFDTLNLIYLTGLSAKGSCGFGMIDVKYEKDNVHL
jgi:CRISPR-associated endoribonuclease Cas6